jgi:hypothetical protein
LIEAANRAEATALLIRQGYRVFSPEADVEGVDFVVRTPDSELRPVQLKGRPTADIARYGSASIWILFPEPGQVPFRRKWFLVPHELLLAYVKERRRSEKPLKGRSMSSIPKPLAKLIAKFEVLYPTQPDTNEG